MLLNKLKTGVALLLVVGAACVVPGVLAFHHPLAAGPTEQPAPAIPPDKHLQRAEKAQEQNQLQQDASEVRRRDAHNAMATNEVSKSFSTTGKARVIVEVFNGSIDVNAERGPNVEVRVNERARANTQTLARDALKSIDLSIARDGDTVRVRARRNKESTHEHHIDVQASAHLSVPAGASLNLRTSNGRVTVTGGTAVAEVRTSNGAIRIENHRGQLRLHTSNGPISVMNGAGQLDLNTSNGKIDLQAQRATVSAHTSNGQIHFAGTLADGEHRLHTSNGQIIVTLPADANFRVDAGTSQGHITNEFPSAQAGGRRTTQLHAAVGDHPRVHLDLHTSNGSIQLRREGKGT